MLLWALYPENPYGYYVLLRGIVCPCFIYAALQARKLEKINLVWVLGVTAAIYNPVIPLHLTKFLWSILNLVGMGICVRTTVVFKK